MTSNMSQNMTQCIDACLECYRTCQTLFAQHCLPSGGRHVEPQHAQLMLACAELCRTSAHLLLTGVAQHAQVCAACADLCDACADSCEDVGDMDECVHACRECAQACRRMGNGTGMTTGMKSSGLSGGQLAM